ncbi:hypothetical protein HNR21_005941 [Actinomadura cellulosilytica]|uniref:Uncharacterized protein n=1 Tax=Thermomonospora cellulosilytica TaxID=1411118 RepID=A0A7W3N3V7_9ACTN|nr:hypothetical protein [Thermomonospora cellulosilytica]MBA9007059.1 hypothetical protein [Thermomonospora cellulosilytica]
MGRTDELVFDPGALSAAQRDGDACVACHKRWPRPRVRVGCLPSGSGVFACEDCAPALPRPRPAEPGSGAGRPVNGPAPGEAVSYR